jgi:mono/diheme cytochrome c family protein
MSDAAPSNESFTPTPEPGIPTTDPGRLSDASLQELHAERFAEKEEPAVGFSPVPVFMIMLFTALTFWSAIYIGAHAGGFQWNVWDANWRPSDAASTAPEPPDPLKIGARVYKNSCQQCHGPEGKGVPGTYPPLSGSLWVVGNPSRPVSILLCGLNGPGTIMDNSYNGSMPPLGQSLKDLEISSVLTFVRQAFGNTGAPVDESLVAQLRASIGTRGPMTPSEVLQKFPLEAPGAGAAPASAPASAPAAATGLTAVPAAAK